MKTTSSLTIRGVIIGVIGLLFITTSSLYVALRLGALPWPTVFVTVLSVALLNGRKGSTLQEITTTHTLMSAGSMVAGGIAFTLPGLWILNKSNSISLFSVIIASVFGALLGAVFTYLYRDTMLMKQKLPYPIGEAAYKTLITFKEKKNGAWLFSSLSFSALFTFIRDFFAKIPAVLTIFKGGSMAMPLSLYMSPMAFSIGAIIGPTLGITWGVGMVLGYYVLTPLGIRLGWFSSLDAANDFRSNLALGIMIGLGVAVVLKALFGLIVRGIKNKGAKKEGSSFKEKSRGFFDDKLNIALLVASIICFALFVIFTSVGFLEAILMVLGVAVATYLSSLLTGQTGINPMEIFALLVVFIERFVFNSGLISLFTVAVAVAVATGLSGDVMNDFKSGLLVNTNKRDQVLAEVIGGILGAVVASVVIFLMKDVYEFGSTSMPSPQAKAVALSIGGLTNPTAFYIGLAVGALLFFFGVASSILGLGMYLGTNITVAVLLGTLTAFVVKKCGKEKAEERGSLVYAGLLGGEGFAGVIIAIVTMLKALL